jgi:TonB family protein
LIHFDFEDRYQDELVVGSAISRREGTLLSIGFHVAVILLILYGGKLALFQPSPEELERRRQEVLQQQLEQQRNQQRFVFVQPRVDTPAPKPPPRPELSDLDRRAASPEISKQPNNPLPLSRGNSAERAEATPAERARGEEAPTPHPRRPSRPSRRRGCPRPTADSGNRSRCRRPQPARSGTRCATCSNTCRRRPSTTRRAGRRIQGRQSSSTPRAWSSARGSGDSCKRCGETGSYPTPAFTFHGRVVLQFNIHRDGHITDLVVAQPSDIDAFNRAAFNAILGSNPVEPLPPEYPDDRAFFTVTFYYNESPGN